MRLKGLRRRETAYLSTPSSIAKTSAGLQSRPAAVHNKDAYDLQYDEEMADILQEEGGK